MKNPTPNEPNHTDDINADDLFIEADERVDGLTADELTRDGCPDWIDPDDDFFDIDDGSPYYAPKSEDRIW